MTLKWVKYAPGTRTTPQNALILLQIVMVSPGPHLVENHETQFKKQ